MSKGLPSHQTVRVPPFYARVLSFPESALALFLFTALEALPIFLQEQSIYTREHSRGAYRVISYSMTNFLIYVPVFALMAISFTAISYFMIDLPPAGFGVQVLAIFMVLLEGNAFATFVSGFAPDPLTVRFSFAVCFTPSIS